MWDKHWLESLVANVPGAIYRGAYNDAWEMEFMSDGVEQITGYPASDFLGNGGRTYASIIHPEDAAIVGDQVAACLARQLPFDIEYRVNTATGEVCWVHEQGRATFGDAGEVLYLDGAIFDIGERKRLEAQLEYLAYHDALTDLPNRRRLMEDLEEADGRFLLVFFDLDGFKVYNDSFGHVDGDLLLRRLARKLREAVGDRGVAYRLGGDEFCVFGPRPTDEGDELIAAARLALIEQGKGFSVEASWGAVLVPDEAPDPTAALVMADQRMYADKGAGRLSARQQARAIVLRVLEERNPELHAHSGAVAEMARAVGKRMGIAGGQLDDLERAAELHDIGKIAIPDTILHKPGPLDAEEWSFMHRHTLIGESMLGAAPALEGGAGIVRSSHERYDGLGYPDGLSGDEIPLGSRIVFVCDAYDAMTSERPYGAAASPEDALAELASCAGSQFDPAVVKAFRAEFPCSQFAQDAAEAESQAEPLPLTGRRAG